MYISQSSGALSTPQHQRSVGQQGTRIDVRQMGMGGELTGRVWEGFLWPEGGAPGVHSSLSSMFSGCHV